VGKPWGALFCAYATAVTSPRCQVKGTSRRVPLGSYLWALVVCQSDRMWTLMVYIFQLQQWAPPYVTMAATVLASIPTLLVFVFAQKTIMRGIIIPAYK